jgi:hypothetical protein
VHGAGAETFEAMKVLRAADPQRYQPSTARSTRRRSSAAAAARSRS